MFITGDVLAVVALILGICVTVWALMVTGTLLFPHRAELARAAAADSPMRMFGLGLVLTFTVGTFGMILLNLPNPVIKLLGFVVVMALLACAAVGASGISMIAGDRLRALAPEISPYGAYSRGALLIVIAGALPMFGWLAFTPILLIMSIGAGFRAMRQKIRTSESVASVVS